MRQSVWFVLSRIKIREGVRREILPSGSILFKLDAKVMFEFGTLWGRFERVLFIVFVIFFMCLWLEMHVQINSSSLVS